jgi:hypothetical protein
MQAIRFVLRYCVSLAALIAVAAIAVIVPPFVGGHHSGTALAEDAWGGRKCARDPFYSGGYQPSPEILNPDGKWCTLNGRDGSLTVPQCYAVGGHVNYQNAGGQTIDLPKGDVPEWGRGAPTSDTPEWWCNYPVSPSGGAPTPNQPQTNCSEFKADTSYVPDTMALYVKNYSYKTTFKVTAITLTGCYGLNTAFNSECLNGGATREDHGYVLPPRNQTATNTSPIAADPDANGHYAPAGYSYTVTAEDVRTHQICTASGSTDWQPVDMTPEDTSRQ